MSTYKGIKGFSVKYLSADPPVTNEGQVWYNSTDGKLKVFGQVAGGTAWATGDNLSVGQSAARAAGTVTSAVIFGGNTTADNPFGGSNDTQSYNGTAWSTEPDMPYYTAAHFGNGDTNGLSSSIVCGGRDNTSEGLTSTASWNGTTWSSEASFPNAVRYGFCGGTGENIICSGGLAASPPTAFPNASSTYNGTSWSSAPALNTNRSNGFSNGTATSTLATGGCTPPYCTNSSVNETWNGTTWSPATSYPGNVGGFSEFAGGGMPTGFYSYEANRTDWNGTSWASGTAAPISKNSVFGFGTSSNATFAGGSLPGTPGIVNTTESWLTSSPSIQAKDITTS
jgi:hypothetical protein